VPVEEAFKMWEDREKIPQWMPWIHSVKVQPGAERQPPLQGVLTPWNWEMSTEQCSNEYCTWCQQWDNPRFLI